MHKQTTDQATSKKSKITTQFPAQNEGEGSSTGAKKYDADVREFVKSGAVDSAAKDAARALDGAEAPELAEAETIGKRGGKDVERGRKPAKH